jgi:hypothetical protein
MENKRYLDKVIESLVRGTKIDYVKGTVKTPYDNIYTTDLVSLPSGSLKLICMVYFDVADVHTMSSRRTFFKFVDYCINHFGLNVDEVEFVWDKYRDNINKKIGDGE